MPRPRGWKKITGNPECRCFKPAGMGLRHLEESILDIDEYEAIRLKDLLGLGQLECSEKMNISQPTFHRILSRARNKIADCIVNVKAIRIQKAVSCGSCGKSFTKTIDEKCPECGIILMREKQ